MGAERRLFLWEENVRDKYWYMEDRIGFFGAGLLIGMVTGICIMIFGR